MEAIKHTCLSSPMSIAYTQYRPSHKLPSTEPSAAPQVAGKLLSVSFYSARPPTLAF